jgi:hypothetical protein
MKNIGRTTFLGACLLWSSASLAESSAIQEEWSCKDTCKKELKECTEACEKYAKEGAPVCTQACSKLNRECVAECSPSRKSPERRDE